MWAADDGTFYFFSPELLDSSAQAEGEADQPNLYAVQPGADPEFVSTVDTSATKPGPKPKGFVTRDTFLSGLEGPEAIAVDQSNGFVYVALRETQSVARFTSSGAAANFTEEPNAGTNEISGLSVGFGGEGELAVDNAPSQGVLSRALYVTNNGEKVQIFSPGGAEIGALEGFGEACGVAVDQSNGAVYVADYARQDQLSGETGNGCASPDRSRFAHRMAAGEISLDERLGNVFPEERVAPIRSLGKERGCFVGRRSLGNDDLRTARAVRHRGAHHAGAQDRNSVEGSVIRLHTGEDVPTHRLAGANDARRVERTDIRGQRAVAKTVED